MSPPWYDFGACADPGITYDSLQHSFMPKNIDQFPLPSSGAVADLESAICQQLRRDECEASSDAVDACDRARWLFSGYAGQQAADTWNEALGLDGTPPDRSMLDLALVYSSTDPSPSPFDVSTRTSGSTEILATLPTPSDAPTSTASIPPSASTSASSPPPSPSTSITTTSSNRQTNNDNSNGSPFGDQAGSSPKMPRNTVLGLITILLIFMPLV